MYNDAPKDACGAVAAGADKLRKFRTMKIR